MYARLMGSIPQQHKEGFWRCDFLKLYVRHQQCGDPSRDGSETKEAISAMNS
jgi:hypothetical protein